MKFPYYYYFDTNNSFISIKQLKVNLNKTIYIYILLHQFI